MSQTARRLPLAVADQLAAKIRRALEPGCARLAVVGSVRRRCATIGDLEILVIPKAEADLFGKPVPGTSHLDVTLNDLRRKQSLLPVRCGPKAKTYELGHWPGTRLELYIVTEATWAVQMLIRTGPAEFSHRFVTHRRSRGLLPDTMRVWQGRLYRAVKAGAGHTIELDDRKCYEQVPTPTERDLFMQAGVPWLEPEDRYKLADWSLPPESVTEDQAVG